MDRIKLQLKDSLIVWISLLAILLFLVDCANRELVVKYIPGKKIDKKMGKKSKEVKNILK